MVYILSPRQARYLRLRGQRLDPVGVPPAEPAQIVGHLVGIQAQETDSARLAVGIRGQDLLASLVEDARQKERSVIRTWAFRGTLHLLAAADLGWVLPLLGPAFIRASRRRYAQLGLTEERYASAVRSMTALLECYGPMTRPALADQLARRGVSLPGQAIYHMLRRAGLEGIICLGPDNDGEQTYVLLQEWVSTGRHIGEEEAVTELTRRYLAAYAPARPEDLASWSGLGLRQSRTGFEQLTAELTPFEVGGSEAWMLNECQGWLEQFPGESGVVRLLPGYDPYLLGYRDRSVMVSQEDEHHIHPGGGVIRPTAVLDGCAVGTWRQKRKGSRIEVTVEPFGTLNRQTTEALESEIQRLERFWEMEILRDGLPYLLGKRGSVERTSRCLTTSGK